LPTDNKIQAEKVKVVNNIYEGSLLMQKLIENLIELNKALMEELKIGRKEISKLRKQIHQPK